MQHFLVLPDVVIGGLNAAVHRDTHVACAKVGGDVFPSFPDEEDFRRRPPTRRNGRVRCVRTKVARRAYPKKTNKKIHALAPANKHTCSGVLDDGTVIPVMEKHILVLAVVVVDRLHGVGTAEHRDGHDDRVHYSGWFGFRKTCANATTTSVLR